MTNSSDVAEQAMRNMSALADGELDAAQVKEALDAWSAQPQARRAWHDYHLIGDVLRSEDLASAAATDAAFLDAVRQRLAAEPVVLAPQAPTAVAAPLHQRASGDRRFGSFVAIAAGFLVVVAGTLTITGLPFSSGTSSVDPVIARSKPAVAPVAAPADATTSVAAASAGASDPVNQVEATVASGQLIRDARLDRYFAAHHQWSGNTILGGHAAYMRSGANEAPGR